MDENIIKELIHQAKQARKFSYCVYSHFQVGAALLSANGSIFTGCNIESASYSPNNCAERTAFFKAISEGEHKFSAIAIVGGRENEEAQELCPPCGVCRQVMIEFCDPESFHVILAKNKDDWKIFSLSQLLPLPFGPKNIQF